MPNLSAIFSPDDGEESIRRRLDRMVAATDLPGISLRCVRQVAPGFQAANLIPRPEWTALDDAPGAAGMVLLLDGEVLNGADVHRELGDASTFEPENILGLIGRAYAAWGEEAFLRLGGCFNVLLLDRTKGSLTIASDRLGSRPLYYGQEGARFIVSSEMKGVLAGREASPRVGLGMVELFLAGRLSGDRTWLDGVHVFPPGSVWTLRRGGIERRRYYRARFRASGRTMSHRAYIDAFAGLLRRATERCMSSPSGTRVGITLSGGLDSRSILLSIDPRHLPIPSFTYGAPDSADVQIAEQLARRKGLNHCYLEPMAPSLVDQSAQVIGRLLNEDPVRWRSFFSCQMDRVLWRCEGLGTLDSMASAIWHPVYQSKAQYLLNGAAGDALTGSHLSPLVYLFRSRSKMAQHLLRSAFWQDESRIKPLFREGFFRDAQTAARSRFLEDIAGMEADDPVSLANVWDIENRQRRGTFASFTMERYFASCRCPYLDHELVDFLADIPVHERFQQRLYKEMILTAFPAYQDVPWAYTKGRITASPVYEFAREGKNFAKDRVGRFWRSRTAPPRWAFRDVRSLLRQDARLFEGLESFLAHDTFPAEVFDRDGIRTFVQNFRNVGLESDRLAFSMLAGFARLIPWFFARASEVPPTANPAHFLENA
jgi:asparagine synthase (glutamine-hydrolysing)